MLSVSSFGQLFMSCAGRRGTMTAASNEKGSSARIRSGAPSTFFKHPCQIWTVRSHARSRKIRLSFEIAISIHRRRVLANLGQHGAPESRSWSVVASAS